MPCTLSLFFTLSPSLSLSRSLPLPNYLFFSLSHSASLSIAIHTHPTHTHSYSHSLSLTLSHTVGHECDLAMLAIDDPTFWSELDPLEFGPIPDLLEDVSVIGYPVGGDR